MGITSMTETSIHPDRPHGPRTDYRDLTISELLVCEAELVDRVKDLEHDLVVYRELAQHALAMAAGARREAASDRRRRFVLIEEFRTFRAMTMARSLANSASEKSGSRDRVVSARQLPIRACQRPVERPHA